MLVTVTAERPDTPDAVLLIDELQTLWGVVRPAGEPARVERGAIDQGRRGVFRGAG